jgi:hypothetical protein
MNTTSDTNIISGPTDSATAVKTDKAKLLPLNDSSKEMAPKSSDSKSAGGESKELKIGAPPAGELKNKQEAIPSSITKKGGVKNRNALCHGVFSNEILLPWESEVDFEQLHASFNKEWTPNGCSEEMAVWPAPGFEDTEFGVLMEPEVRHGEAEVYTRVQA